jgi:hypothetical protein
MLGKVDFSDYAELINIDYCVYCLKGGNILQLSRCTLKKDGKKVIIQGMIHGLSSPLLVWLKKDLKNQTRNGYRILCEGIRIYEDDEEKANFSEKELEVHKCRKLFDDFKEEAMKSMNLVSQFSGDESGNEGLEYPDNAINIDISYLEYIRSLTKLLEKANIDCKKITGILEATPREKIIVGIAKNTESLLSGKKTLKELEVTAMTVDFFKIANSIDMEYRNEVAAKKINTTSKKKKINKIYVHYGETHIEGIAHILVNKYGWRLTKTIEIDSQNPALR